jgi:hypothetical protein
MMLTLRTLLTTSAATLALCGPTIAQEAPSKSIFTSGEKGAYHTLFCPPLPAALSNAYFQGYTCASSRGTLENIDHVRPACTGKRFGREFRVSTGERS